MLLLLLLQGQQTRLLIDALMEVTPISQAAVCRDSGVPASSLSRFRRPGGEGQISAQKQDQLLVALGMSEGHLMGDRVHIWDANGDVRAITWLLENALTTPAELALLRPAPATHFGFRDLLIGRAGLARLLIRSRRAPLNNLLTHPLSRPFDGKRQITVAEAVIPLLCRRNVSTADFDMATRRMRTGMRPIPVRSQLWRQVRQLGMTEQHLQCLLMDWLIERARTKGAELTARLEQLDSLELDTGLVTPSKMTPAQRQALVERLSKRSCRAGLILTHASD